SRYYDPQVGRFLNADGLVSTGQGLLGSNMFAYCLNNPVKNVDHMGAAAKHILQRLTGEGMVYEEYESLLREYNNLILSEHRKRGTTNKANREKHQRGQSRKLKDNGGEKKDSRMHPNPNKRKPLKQSAEIEYDNYVYDKQTNNELSNFNIPMKQEVSLLDKIGASIMLVGSLGVVVYVVANDSTGIGVADDGCLAFLIPFIQKT
ncbi:MAG: hypothetical protein J6L23_02890, partial [Clostridia bacterium]|nr:hypothetical protein [Clostridia bacterium]